VLCSFVHTIKERTAVWALQLRLSVTDMPVFIALLVAFFKT